MIVLVGSALTFFFLITMSTIKYNAFGSDFFLQLDLNIFNHNQPFVHSIHPESGPQAIALRFDTANVGFQFT